MNLKRNKCLQCGMKFYPSRSDQLFCCKKCRLKYYSENRKTK